MTITRFNLTYQGSRWKEGERPPDKLILSCRKTVKAEKEERQRLAKELHAPQGSLYGLIEKIADTLTTKELKS